MKVLLIKSFMSFEMNGRRERGRGRRREKRDLELHEGLAKCLLACLSAFLDNVDGWSGGRLVDQKVA